MPPPDAPPTKRGLVLRTLGFGIAIALGAVAVWLIVTSTSQKRIEIGVLAGIWGALLGAYAMFGARRLLVEAGEPAAAAEVPVLSAQEIATRSSGEVERIAEAAARRDFEDRLEQMLRRELAREVGDLRAEIARLRQDLLDKVGGQLRLERIETTRVIGSDLEALQHEVRQLKQASETGSLHELGLGAGSHHLVVEQASVRSASRPAAVASVDDRLARPAEESAAPHPEPVRRPARAEAPGPVETTGPIRMHSTADPQPQPSAHPTPRAAADPTPAAKAPAAATPSATSDPFASLPRITPFTEFELEPIDTAGSRTGADDDARREASPDVVANSAYTGRRRRTDGDDDPDADRHASPDAVAQAVPVGGRRRRRDDDDNNDNSDNSDNSDDSDLLSRLLARRGADR